MDTVPDPDPDTDTAAAPRRVVLVRPWTDGRGGGGCCGGEVRDGVCLDGVCLDGEREPGHEHDPDPVGVAWRLLRARRPDVDVQVVDAGNTAWLLPWSFREVRRRSGAAAGLRAALRATTAGAVLIDGERVGRLAELGPDGVLAAVDVHSAAR